jgi:pyridoxal phosphate enzyme (YggS family)
VIAVTPLAANWDRVRDRIARAAERSGRRADAVTLVAVTKNRSAADVDALWQLGQRDFGENRVQEAVPKMEAGPPAARWHLIGHLQENKINKILPRVFMIQSIDSVALAAAVAQRALRCDRRVPVLIEVKTSTEASKFGIEPARVVEAAAEVAALEALELRGFMTLAPQAAPAVVRRAFATLREAAQSARPSVQEPCVLSMGMSEDYEIAIEEGATMVRIGRALWQP